MTMYSYLGAYKLKWLKIKYLMINKIINEKWLIIKYWWNVGAYKWKWLNMKYLMINWNDEMKKD